MYRVFINWGGYQVPSQVMGGTLIHNAKQNHTLQSGTASVGSPSVRACHEGAGHFSGRTVTNRAWLDPWVHKARHTPHRALKFAPGVKQFWGGALSSCHLLTCPPPKTSGGVGIRDLGAHKLLFATTLLPDGAGSPVPVVKKGSRLPAGQDGQGTPH